jgi:hypothetical protein
MGSYVGIDLHRQRSVIAVLNDDGDRVSWSRINNTPAALASELAAAGPDAEVPVAALLVPDGDAVDLLVGHAISTVATGRTHRRAAIVRSEHGGPAVREPPQRG